MPARPDSTASARGEGVPREAAAAVGAVREDAVAECPFCEIAAREEHADLVAWRGERVLVVVPPRQRPRNRGHALVVPRGHETSLDAMGDDALAELFGTAARTGAALRRAFGAVGTTWFQNDDAPGQALPHVHVHVVPRFEGDGFRMPDPGVVDVPRADRAAQARAIRDAWPARGGPAPGAHLRS
jgi:histidine triad (HIT) family protein